MTVMVAVNSERDSFGFTSPYLPFSFRRFFLFYLPRLLGGFLNRDGFFLRPFLLSSVLWRHVRIPRSFLVTRPQGF